MNNIQLYLSIGIPTFAVLLAWLSNRSEMNRLGDRLDGRIDRLDSKIERLDSKIERLNEQQHKDALMLQGYMIPLHERMAKLEHTN